MNGQETITVTLPAGAARFCAEELFQTARDARDQGEPARADLVEQVAGVLHREGWKAAQS